MAKGYIYAEVEVTNPEQYEKYRVPAGASIVAFGGQPVVRRGDPETLEGERRPKLVVIIEFESRERALEWYNSPQYQEAKKLRVGAANTHVLVLSGYQP
jgi:uncharacterized protein (DUF1330 family)